MRLFELRSGKKVNVIIYKTDNIYMSPFAIFFIVVIVPLIFFASFVLYFLFKLFVQRKFDRGLLLLMLATYLVVGLIFQFIIIPLDLANRGGHPPVMIPEFVLWPLYMLFYFFDKG